MQTKSFLPSFLAHTALVVATGALACHEDIATDPSDSATEDCKILNLCTTTESTVPTSSAGEGTPTTGETGGINPLDYCSSHPSNDYEGQLWVCSGSISANFVFDYYGDPSLGLETIMVCIDFTDPDQGSAEKPPGYVYTCFYHLSEYAFGPDIKQPNGQQVEACCLRDSPTDAVAAFCTIDLAEESCRGVSDTVIDLYNQFPTGGEYAELSDQIEALSKYLASADTQMSCSAELASELNDPDVPPAGEGNWSPENNSDWSWFRDINFAIPDQGFSITDETNSGEDCSEINFLQPMGGTVTGGNLKAKTFFGNSNAKIKGGSFTFRRAECNLDTCDFKFESFDADIEDFNVGPLKFHDVHASMLTPASGQLNDPLIGFRENEMRFLTTFRMSMNGDELFDGETVEVVVHNSGTAEARLNPGPKFGIQKISATNWPFELELTTKLSQCY